MFLKTYKNIIIIGLLVILFYHLPFSTVLSYSYSNQPADQVEPEKILGRRMLMTKNESVVEKYDYKRLGLNTIDITVFDDYLGVSPLTEEEFYSLAFNMKIIGLSLTADELLFIRTIDNHYYTIQASLDYIRVLELTEVLAPGSSLRLGEKASSSSNFFGYLFILSLMTTILSYFLWIYFKQRKQKSFETGGLKDSKKSNEKNAVEVSKSSVTFNEVQGIDELKPDLFRLVDSLKNPAKYKRLGARPTKGLILYGPPGTGKTLIAKAISGEAGVPFFSTSGSDFIEKYVGVGASRIRELFAKARKSSPCIVFIDEIDAIGGNRGDGNNSERDQTINALLTELDGFTATEGILTICATNRLDILDSALTRPGRFDLKIAVNLPDKNARFQILKLHALNKTLSPEVDIEHLSKTTNGFSGAELENLLNESALIAATKDKDYITNQDIDDAFFKIIMNGHKKERTKEDKYIRLIAYHEAGHTLATKLLTRDGVSTVTIVQSTSGAGGVTFRSPEDTSLSSKKGLKNLIKVMYAGRAAEEILLNSDEDITTGASQDIKQATEIIKSYIGLYGMGSMGMIDISQLTNQINLIEEASYMASKLYKETFDFLVKNKDKLDKLALELLEKETLYEAEIDSLIGESDAGKLAASYYSSTKAL